MGDKTALVVIDTQLGMFETPGVPPVPDGERLLGKIGGLIHDAREADVTVIHVRHDGGPGHPLERGTGGWPIHPRVAPADGEPVVDKETPDSFLRTTLREELESRGIGAWSWRGCRRSTAWTRPAGGPLASATT